MYLIHSIVPLASYAVFPLFWALGASLIWRRTDYARSDLSASSRTIKRFSSRKSQTPKVNTQGLYIQRIGQLQRQGAFATPNEKSSSTTTLSANTSVSVHLPYADDTWAWACLCVRSSCHPIISPLTFIFIRWAFCLSCAALSVTLLALYANNRI